MHGPRGERVKSTLFCPPRSAQPTGGKREKAYFGLRRGVARGAALPQWRRGSSKGLATKPEAGRERIISLLSPSPITLDELSQAAEARRAVRVALLELELVGRVEYLADRIALCASANET